MTGRVVIVALLLALGACAIPHVGRAPTEPAGSAAAVPPPAAPKPAEGLWAMMDPGCAKPVAVDFRAWPHCASPFWISGQKATVIMADAVGRRSATNKSYATEYSLTPGDPMIAQVGTHKDGYLILALTDLSRDDHGRLVGAIGAAVACPSATGPQLALKPSDNGCDAKPLDVVRRAAAATLQDRAALTEVAWIAPGAP